ncbi:MAG: Sensory box histidine kinase/response regulator [Thermoleophilia bacterium]|nr:Sensory box histidine kinase/response regulator [Thermoleophilia bacterium]
MDLLNEALRYANVSLFCLLAVVAAHRWHSLRQQAALWVTSTFVVLALVSLIGLVLPENSDSAGVEQLGKLNIALLGLFPFCLYRFGLAFSTPSRVIKLIGAGFTVAITTWTLALPYVPETGEARPMWFEVWLWAFLAHWTVLSTIVAVRLWREGHDQPGAVRNRMRMMALAAATLAVALIIAGSANSPAMGIVTQLVGMASGVLFLLGYAPPRALRMAWRHKEQEAVNEATQKLMSATSASELELDLLPRVVALIGGRGAAIVDSFGEPLALHGVSRDEVEGALASSGGTDTDATIRLEFPYGSLVVWTTAYTPLFGDEELSMLRSLGVFMGLALERQQYVHGLQASEAVSREEAGALRVTTAQLREADRLKSQYLAMAAHELRTPLTAIAGFSSTMLNMWDRLKPSETHEFVSIIDGQTARLMRLVDDLLTLSRIEAGVLASRPKPLDVSLVVRQTVRELGADQVDVRCPDGLTVLADDDQFRQIVVNYVSNAIKYGAEPIYVSATTLDGFVCVSVCDSGVGVPDEFVPRLFERFSRDGSRSDLEGTGLGLSIVRGLAEAQGGEAWYEPHEPHGSCFKLKVPLATA